MDAAWVGGISTVVTLVGSRVFDWFMAWRKARTDEKAKDKEEQRADKKQEVEQSIPVNEQAVKIFKEVVEQVRTDMDKVVKSMHATDELLLACREEKITLKAKFEASEERNKAYAEENAKLHLRLDDIEGRMRTQETK